LKAKKFLLKSRARKPRQRKRKKTSQEILLGLTIWW